MSKLATGAAYGASAGTVANSLLTRLSPDEWSAVGVIVGIVIAVMTFCINWYYKRKTTLAQIQAYERCPTSAQRVKE
ncbi:class II holin family protein [Cronobacter turicensis]|nr:class II holin family protein [Cronobacter turicensis]EKY3176897.1 class II holin family protein [Cronobacter turicensis]ELY3774208.1 class II holin family protein [Cronobacter dublinensis]